MFQQVPQSEEILMQRANALAGMTLTNLANKCEFTLPNSVLHAKGWVGQLLEHALGATSGSKPQPDFPELSIELKSIPVTSQGTPKESTYICVVQLSPYDQANWEQSLVRKKLSKVLWIPYEVNDKIPFAARRIGTPILWQASTCELQQLKTDWQELSDLIVLGKLHMITASIGKYLHIRPKAANAMSQTRDKNRLASENITLPRGYYLRTSFTKQILQST